ncbi:MAG: hypothetical protein Q8904_12590 [Bacteroidota bacterium]|nr:hypothetical protein [Bacteroidota bacterium]
MNLKFKLLAIAVCLCSMSFAQLSTRENTTSVFRTGSRPQAGSYGLFIGPSFSEIKDMADNDQFTWRGIPLINIKYYTTDKIEWRLGLQFDGKSTSMSGSDNGTTPADFTNTERNSFNRISVGGAYHFSPKNLLDVYTGAYIPFGWDTYHNEQTTGEYGTVKSKFSPVIGAGAYIGLQAFIADLPISLGLEYGLSGIARFGKQYKNVVTTNGKSETYYTEDKTGSGTTYSKLSLGDSSFGTDVRITFSYYFNK